MPRYDFDCAGCGLAFEAHVPVDERDSVACPRCGTGHGVKRREVHPFAVNIWKPRWFEHIDLKPIYIESRKQLKRECEKRGLIALGLE